MSRKTRWVAYDYRQKNDNVAQLQIIDNKKKDYGKKSVISVCNVDYRVKRSGPNFQDSAWNLQLKLLNYLILK